MTGTGSSTQQEDSNIEADVTVLVAPMAPSNHFRGCADTPRAWE